MEMKALTDTDVLSRISSRLQQTDKSLWGKIKDFLKGLVERLKAAYQGMNPDSSIAQLARQSIQSSENALNAFADAASDAIVNYNLQDGGASAASTVDAASSAVNTVESIAGAESTVDTAISAVNTTESIARAESSTAGVQKNAAQENAERSVKRTEYGEFVAAVSDDILQNTDPVLWSKEDKANAIIAAREALAEFGEIVVYDITDDQFGNICQVSTEQMRSGKLLPMTSSNYKAVAIGNVLMGAGKNQYSVSVYVGKTQTGDNVFCGVRDIKPTQFTVAEGRRRAAAPSDVRNISGKLQEGQKNNAQEGVRYSLRGQTQQELTTSYQAEVDNVLSNPYVSPHQLIVGYTPSLYESLGMPSLPLTIGSGHVYSAAKTEAEAKRDGNFRKGVHYHGLGDAAVKNIYSAIQDPVMVIAAKDVNKNVSPMRSTHSVVAIVDIGTAQKSLLVPIEITAERKVNGMQMDVNTISSIYEKSVGNLVNEAIALENSGDIGIFYAKKEALTLPVAGVQFPAQLQQSIASDGIVHRFSEKVNMKISDVTQSQQFKRWFGDWQNDPKNASKVVNADGTPKVMYHGTDGEFTIFDRSKGKKKIHLNVFGDGNYFTALETSAARYGKNVMGVFLDIKNPYISKSAYNTVADQIASDFGLDRTTYTGKDVSSILKSRGYDGVLRLDENGDVVIANAFDSNQIKSATDNIGTFDGTNPDIRFSSRQSQEVKQALEDYRYQRDVEFKAMKAVYDAERSQIEQAHRAEMKALEPEFRRFLSHTRSLKVYHSSLYRVMEACYPYTKLGIRPNAF